MQWWRAACARVGVHTATGRDAVVAVVLAVLGLSRLLLAVGAGPGLPSGPVLLLANVAATAELGTIAIRRRVPRTALALATAAVLASAALPARYSNTGVGLLVCAYTVAAVLPRRDAVITLAAAAVAHAVGGIVVMTLGGRVRELLTFWGNDGSDPVDLVLATAASFAVSGLIGSYVQTRRAYTAELVARAAHLEEQREQQAHIAVMEERARIARELHDVAAHDLSAIVVQAGAADRLVTRDPDAARQTLRALRAQGRETMAALRQLVGIMRADAGAGGAAIGMAGHAPGRDGQTAGAGDDRAPQPTLGRLDDLLAGARAAGMAVTVTASGRPRSLPAAADLTAYRTVQEALTNARRHAPGAPVTVAVTWHEQTVDITITNAAPPAPASQVDAGGGHGLPGMRERVLQAGGTVTVGATPDGGWQVQAQLPCRRPEDP